MNQIYNLPPEVEKLPNGQLIRRIATVSADGTSHYRTRYVALTREEAKQKAMDWYHPELGWVIDGFKLETDRGAKELFDDASQTIPADPSSEKGK